MEDLGGMTADEHKLLTTYVETGFIFEEVDRLILTEKGKLQADGIASAFFRLD
jgi:coproporphyrinogen III oxidase-like Fe-S oxidoreductase